jgi:hypothetical protein
LFLHSLHSAELSDRGRKCPRAPGTPNIKAATPNTVAGKRYTQLFQARSTMLIYTAFTNLICNKE